MISVVITGDMPLLSLLFFISLDKEFRFIKFLIETITEEILLEITAPVIKLFPSKT
jgi:hypothetical protein